MKKNKGFSLISVIIIICITSITSALTTGIIVTNNYGLSYSELAEDSALVEFLQTYSQIVSNYYEDIDTEEMLDTALDAMLEYLGDNYTTYLNTEESTELEERLAGTYEGIGISISGTEIVSVSSGSPAEEAGLQAGDIFVSIDNIDVSEYSADQIAILIKTATDSVNITVLRGEEYLDFEVSIGTIISSSISYTLLENNIGYIKMDIFSKTLTTQVESALSELESLGMDRLIIDLRDNTGGYLDSAEDTASLFLEKGKLIYSLEDKDGASNYYDTTATTTTYPIVIITNSNTASASEILAAALKYSYGATLVGTTSYGKGKVQQTYELSDGSMAKYTSAKWLTPNGDCIDGIGLTPDVEVDLTYEYDEEGNITSVIDTQLSKSIEIISAM